MWILILKWKLKAEGKKEGQGVGNQSLGFDLLELKYL